ncbi:MAG: dTDP-4-dehydrorhamnose 3,5-epimerase [Miltoncostaeaceae bacterium]|nr:dTDP-4-dehydrorhamnose 3,5-epimerase [Miltoncostaeaceae bacterium]
MRRLPTDLEGPVLIEPSVFADERGFFLESFREDRLAELGIHERFVQDNHSRSRGGVVRGMHFTVGEGQAKLVRVARGEVLDVVVDIRRGSPTFGRWESFELDDRDGRLLFVPIGFAHGFAVLSDVADVLYKCSSYYDGGLERGFAWNDPEVGIAWPIEEPVISERDRVAPRLAEIAEELPFRYPSGVAA